MPSNCLLGSTCRIGRQSIWSCLTAVVVCCCCHCLQCPFFGSLDTLGLPLFCRNLNPNICCYPFPFPFVSHPTCHPMRFCNSLMPSSCSCRIGSRSCRNLLMFSCLCRNSARAPSLTCSYLNENFSIVLADKFRTHITHYGSHWGLPAPQPLPMGYDQPLSADHKSTAESHPWAPHRRHWWFWTSLRMPCSRAPYPGGTSTPVYSMLFWCLSPSTGVGPPRSHRNPASYHTAAQNYCPWRTICKAFARKSGSKSILLQENANGEGHGFSDIENIFGQDGWVARWRRGLLLDRECNLNAAKL